MPITRDADFPAPFAQLMKAMSAVCDGHSLDAVEQASGNLFAAAIHNGAKLRGVTEDDFPRYARAMLDAVFNSAVENWNRRPKPTDVLVAGH